MHGVDIHMSEPSDLVSHLGSVDKSQHSRLRALPTTLRHKLEASFAQDFSRVRVKICDEPKNYGSKAYSHAHEIVVCPIFYKPDTCTGIRLLARELAHIVQRGQGRIPLGHMGGSGSTIDMDLQIEAEQAADYCVYAVFGQAGAAGTVMPPKLLVPCSIGPRRSALS